MSGTAGVGRPPMKAGRARGRGKGVRAPKPDGRDEIDLTQLKLEIERERPHGVVQVLVDPSRLGYEDLPSPARRVRGKFGGKRRPFVLAYEATYVLDAGQEVKVVSATPPKQREHTGKLAVRPVAEPRRSGDVVELNDLVSDKLASALRATPSSRRYVGLVVETIAAKLAELVERVEDEGGTLPETQAVLDAFNLALPDPMPQANPLAEQVGPFYRSEAVIKVLGITKQALGSRRNTGSVLAARTSDDVWAYPVWQFDLEHRRVRSDMAPVLKILRPLDGWTAALWFRTENPELEGKAPADAVADDQDAVVTAAKHFVAAMTRA